MAVYLMNLEHHVANCFRALGLHDAFDWFQCPPIELIRCKQMHKAYTSGPRPKKFQNQVIYIGSRPKHGPKEFTLGFGCWKKWSGANMALTCQSFVPIQENTTTLIISLSMCYSLELHNYLGVPFFTNEISIGCSFAIEHKWLCVLKCYILIT